MEEDAYDVVACYGDVEDLLAKKEYHMKEGKVNMCRAIREMLEDERAEGRAEGIVILVETLQEMGCAMESVVVKVSEKFEMKRDIAMKHVMKYWKGQ